MFDVAIRMLDTQGKEVLPSEFLPAAERNDLMQEHRPLGARRLAVVRSPSASPICCSCACRATALLDASLLQWLDCS